ncbi:PKD domain-containing protein [Georgenia sp. TF02-10]|uniref:PKD domain-containing protein n=1 Tax=Georgenia sp. TF02-10 TaxID=2917725 RepID=UPI001FA7E973|nr:PKD domain-containing protein [Georgenia sp. TF02-10]UNX55575.1 PKD domain-containing protein [Georgenia sp. TF02-10]
MRRRALAALLFVLALVAPTALGQSAAGAAEVEHQGVVSGSPAAFTPHVLDGIVFSVAEVGETIVLGGSFTQVQAANGGPVLTRNRLVAFNKRTGQISATFAPNVNNSVRSVVPAADGQSVYVGGQFGAVNGATSTRVVRLRLSDGARIASFAPPSISGVVHDMKLVGSRLFIGGEFTRIGNQTRTALAELDPGTGALRPGVNLAFAGTHRGGTTHVHKFDVNSAGTTLVATGNFATVNGQDRVQVAMLDLTPAGATLAAWHTDRWKPECYASFEYYLNDLDFAPDGSYFILSSMGGYGSGPPTLCDTISRWETAARGSSLNPTWVNYTGGDSVYAVEAVGDAIYIGGHHRWVNNPFGRDAPGEGAVEREGIGVLDPVNGMPLSWDPGRTRGRGVFDLLAVRDGLWVGSDTDRIAGFQYRGRIAYFPRAGGTIIPRPEAPDLPVDVIQTGAVQSADARYLYRVNAGAGTLPAIDNGPDWVGDTEPPGSTYRNTGNAATWTPVPTVTPEVPATAPRALFASERWDSGDAPELQWNFPVPAGRNVQVRLYLANSCDCTATPGSRVFDVALENNVVLDDLDLVAQVGHRVGTMRAFDVVSDGTVNIELRHVTENPLINGIEIVDLDAPPPGTGTTNAAQVRPFDGDQGGAARPLAAGNVPWDGVRGGFLADGQLYLAGADGTLTRRPFRDGTAGPATTLDLHGLGTFAAEMQSMTGLFYTHGRIYYTLAGQSSLFMRYFEVESGIVGAQRFTHSGNLPGMTWSAVRGMFLAGDGVFWADATGNLHRLGWTGNVGDGQVTGPDQIVSGPGSDGADWRGRALIALPGTTPPPPPPANQPPVAAFTQQCTGLTCTFDGSSSTDPDGRVVGHAWDLAGRAATGATQTHTFPAAGDYPVRLTVTDDRGATSTLTRTVTVAQEPPPPTSDLAFVGSSATQPTGSATQHSAQVPAAVAAGDLLVATFATNAAGGTVTGPAGWTQAAQTSTTSMSGVIWTKAATAADAGRTITVGTSGYQRGNVVVAAYRGADLAGATIAMEPERTSRAAHTTPTLPASPGDWVASYWADKTASTTGWTPPGGLAVRQTGAGTGAGHLSWLYADSGGGVSGSTAGGLTATATSATANAVMATIVIRPASAAAAADATAPAATDAAEDAAPPATGAATADAAPPASTDAAPPEAAATEPATDGAADDGGPPAAVVPEPAAPTAPSAAPSAPAPHAPAAGAGVEPPVAGSGEEPSQPGSEAMR